MSVGGKVQSKKYELVAPDGGWGYAILASFIINVSAGCVFAGSFGMVFEEFLIEINMTSTWVTILTGLGAFCFAISGFFTSSLLKVMSRRKLALVGALLIDAGFIGVIFANSIATLVIFQGILPGISVGIMYNLCCSIINDYFVRKRMLAFSIVQCAVGALTMVAPLFVKWSLEEFGFRGTLALIAGITLNNLFGVLLMHPVEWHMKRVEVLITTEMQPLLIEEKNKDTIIKLTEETMKSEAPVEKNNEVITESEKPNNFRNYIEENSMFFKKFVLSCVCIGPSVAYFAENIFCLILPQALYTSGWSKDMVATALALYAFGDLAMRTLLIFISNWIVKFGSQETFILSLIVATVSRLGMIWTEIEMLIYVYMVIMGVARCFIIVLMTVVISEAVPADKFTQAMGAYQLCSGTTLLVFGAAIGAIRDLTNSYSTAFYLIASSFAIIVLFWSIELLYKRNKGKRNAQKEIQAKSNQSNKRK